MRSILPLSFLVSVLTVAHGAPVEVDIQEASPKLLAPTEPEAFPYLPLAVGISTPNTKSKRQATFDDLMKSVGTDLTSEQKLRLAEQQKSLDRLKPVTEKQAAFAKALASGSAIANDPQEVFDAFVKSLGDTVTPEQASQLKKQSEMLAASLKPKGTGTAQAISRRQWTPEISQAQIDQQQMFDQYIQSLGSSELAISTVKAAQQAEIARQQQSIHRKRQNAEDVFWQQFDVAQVQQDQAVNQQYAMADQAQAQQDQAINQQYAVADQAQAQQQAIIDQQQAIADQQQAIQQAIANQ